jgi:predicted lipid-binding transport protein (Tim44 family)
LLLRGFWNVGPQENLDYVYSDSAVEPKAQKTLKLLNFLARQDTTMAPAALADVTAKAFTLLQQCWQGRDYAPMGPLMMPNLYAEHCRQIQAMVASHEIDRIEGVKIIAIHIVNVRYTSDPNKREFTALITASARDYYIDDRTNTFLRGDQSPQVFQEFWTFHRFSNAWLLRQIEQSRESDALKEENFFEQFTDAELKQLYGETAGGKGQAGPWLDKATETKANRTERLLNFLAQTDKLWDRTQMLERARQVFTDVYVAVESTDERAIRPDELFPDIVLRYQGVIRQWKDSQSRIEYRNLCVRTVELILVRNYNDNSKDEYTVRISSHAQRIVTTGEKVVQRDPDVTPFVEYWTFGRLDNQWKLKEILPPGEGVKDVSLENVDEGSSPGQMDWFYKQTRAN